MFKSLASRFPDPLPPDFFEFDPAGNCFVGFSAYERSTLHAELKTHNLGPIRIVIFFDDQEKELASIYIHLDGSTDSIIMDTDRKYDNTTDEMLVTYMMDFYPDIGEYLLWHQ